MAAIKNWFQKKKADIKFKSAGQGHRLNEEPQHRPGPARQQGAAAVPRSQRPSDDSRARAAEAAMQRFQKKSTPEQGPQQAMRAKVRKELASLSTGIDKFHVIDEKEFEHAPVMSVSGVFYTCPLLGDAVKLPRADIEARLEAFLREQYLEEPLMASAAMIASLNRSAEKRAQCAETIQRYISNVLDHPDDEKYRKVRRANKVYAQKVVSCKGAVEFLEAVGFKPKELKTAEGFPDQFLVMDSVDMGTLATALEYLATTDPIPIFLDRSVKILMPGYAKPDVTLPPDFYDRTADEIKKDQTDKTVETEKVLALRTREMRERDELKRIYKYRFTLLRIRFPDDYVLQGTFRSTETLADIDTFIRDHIVHPDLPYMLRDTRGKDLLPDASTEEAEPTLAHLGLTPAAVLVFAWDPDVAGSGVNEYLTEELRRSAVSV